MEDQAITKYSITKIDCPICIQNMEAPVYQCLSGHTVCGNCIKKVTHCPTCRGTLNENIRNYFLEKLCEDLKKYVCKYEPYGCEVLLPMDKIHDHEVSCTFSNFKCGVSGCNFDNCRSELIKHMHLQHPKEITRNYLNGCVPYNYVMGTTLESKLILMNLTWFHAEPVISKHITFDNDKLFRICYNRSSLHVHSFNFGEEDQFKFLYYYQNEEEDSKKRCVMIRETCKDFNEACGGRRNILFSHLENVLPSENCSRGYFEIIFENFPTDNLVKLRLL